MHHMLTRPVGISTVFQRPLTVPLHSPNGRQMPAVRVVQGDCEGVYLQIHGTTAPGNTSLHWKTYRSNDPGENLNTLKKLCRCNLYPRLPRISPTLNKIASALYTFQCSLTNHIFSSYKCTMVSSLFYRCRWWLFQYEEQFNEWTDLKLRKGPTEGWFHNGRR